MKITLSVWIFFVAVVLYSEEMSSVDCLIVVHPLPQELCTVLQPVIIMFKTNFRSTGVTTSKNIMSLPRIYVGSDGSWKTNIAVGTVLCSVRRDENSLSNALFSVSVEDEKDVYFADNIVVPLKPYTATVSLTARTHYNSPGNSVSEKSTESGVKTPENDAGK